MTGPRRPHPRVAVALALALIAGRATAQEAVDSELEAAVQPGTDSDDDVAAEARAESRLAIELSTLLRRSRDDDAPSHDTLVEAVGALGPETIDVALAVLEERAIPDIAGAPRQVLNRFQRAILFDAITGWGRAAVLPRLEQRLTVAAEPRHRATAIDVYGVVGWREDLPRFAELAATDADGTLPRAVATAVHDATTTWIRRDPGSVDDWIRLAPALEPATLAQVVQGAGDSHERDATELVVFALARKRELTGLALAQIPKLGPASTVEENETLVELVRAHLDPSDTRTASTAAVACGYLESSSPIDDLILLLDSEHEGLRRNAYDALRRLTGLAFPETPQMWKSWYMAETRWRMREAPTALRYLKPQNTAALRASLRDISQRRLQRHELAQRVATLLEADDTAVCTAACRTLASLGSIWSVPALEACLEDPRPAVRTIACRTLASIVGGAHPCGGDGEAEDGDDLSARAESP